MFDPILGYVVAPGATVTWAREGQATSRWAAHGVRRAGEPEPGIPAILTLGDSFTEAFMVGDEDVFTHRLEQLLRADGVRVDVLNAGRSGASAADYVALAAHYRQLFAPRWTIVELRDEDLGSGAWTEQSTHFTSGAGGAVSAVFVAPPRHPVLDLLRPLRTRSALVDYACIRLREFAEAFDREPPLFRATSAAAQAATHSTDDSAVRYPIAAELQALHDAYSGRITLLYLSDFDLRRPEAAIGTVEPVFDALCRERRWSCVNLRAAYALGADGVVIGHRSRRSWPRAGRRHRRRVLRCANRPPRLGSLVRLRCRCAPGPDLRLVRSARRRQRRRLVRDRRMVAAHLLLCTDRNQSVHLFSVLSRSRVGAGRSAYGHVPVPNSTFCSMALGV